MSDKATTAPVVLHPKLRESAERLLRTPGLTRETIQRIKRDMHMLPAKPKQMEFPDGK